MEADAGPDGGASMSTTTSLASNTVTTIEEASNTPKPAKPAAAFDFISTYADFADVFEMPREVHQWVAAQMIASVLNGNVSIKWGAVTYPLDFWILLLSGSGQGRNTATD